MILDRYILRNLVQSTLIALAVLLGIFAFFSLVDQLEDTGRGNYGVLQALEYVLLTMPHLAYELFPIASVIGSMITLGQLAHNSELAVIRTAGVSKRRLIWYLFKGGLVLVVIAFIIGELIAPTAEETAQHRRSVSLTEQITLKSKYGFWSRDGQSFINIRKILPGDRVEKIYIYEFDENNELRSSIYAKRAEYTDEQWLLHDIQQSIISEEGVQSRELELASWDALLNPDVINLVIIKPQYLSLWGLYDYIHYLKQNEQNSVRYEQALWFKVGKPFLILLMILISVPLVKTTSRTTAAGHRVFVGCVVGVVFHIINQVSGHLGVVYNVPPFFSMLLPIVLLSIVLSWLLYRHPA